MTAPTRAFYSSLVNEQSGREKTKAVADAPAHLVNLGDVFKRKDLALSGTENNLPWFTVLSRRPDLYRILLALGSVHGAQGMKNARKHDNTKKILH